MQGPAGADVASFELVGFTTTTHHGDTGVFGFTRACQADFPNSRMCTSVEAMNTVSLPVGLTGEAWIRPVFVSSTATSAADASGGETGFATSFTCFGWIGSSSGDKGLTVDSNGRFRSLGCSPARAVACCREVATP